MLLQRATAYGEPFTEAPEPPGRENDAMKNRVVLVAVPDPSAQQHLAGTLSEWGYEPVCAASMEAALLEMAQRRFLVSLLDLGTNVGELLRRLKTQGGSPGAIVVIADADASERAVEATALGADDFLQKPFDSQELLDAIQRALQKSREGLVAESDQARVERRLATLTPREREVLRLVVKGLLNKQIADELGAAEKTVKVHRGRVMRKMQVRSVAELVTLTAELNGHHDDPAGAA